MVGGLFARPTHKPAGDLAKAAAGYEVHLADPLDPAYAGDRIDAQLTALTRVVTRSTGTSPLVATNACANTICPSTRNLADRQLDGIRDPDGVIAFGFCLNDVCPDIHLDAA
jgi:hypothetical protein